MGINRMHRFYTMARARRGIWWDWSTDRAEAEAHRGRRRAGAARGARER